MRSRKLCDRFVKIFLVQAKSGLLAECWWVTFGREEEGKGLGQGKKQGIQLFWPVSS